MHTPLAIAVLALLRERSMHPYEMAQLLRVRHLDELIKVRAGSLYHTVGRLERDGLIEPVGTQREGNRPERTTYRVTPAGDAAVEGWVAERLAQPVNEFPIFPYALTEAHNLTADQAVDALAQRVAALEADIARVEELLCQPTTSAAPARRELPHVSKQVYRLGAEHRVAMWRAELAWTRDLIERIERKDFPWEPWT